MVKIYEHEEAKILRGEGWSLGKISTKLNVSKSSVSVWVRNVELTDEQKANLIFSKGRGKGGQFIGALNNQKKWMKLWEEYREKGRIRAREINDKDYMIGCSLYWAEGCKGQRTVGFTNSDPNMVKFFVKFLKEYFDLNNDDLVICVNCYLNNGLSLEQIQKFWLETLGFPKSCMRKCTIKTGVTQKKAKWPYGVCRISVYDFRIFHQIMGSIEEYFCSNHDIGKDS